MCYSGGSSSYDSHDRAEPAGVDPCIWDDTRHWFHTAALLQAILHSREPCRSIRMTNEGFKNLGQKQALRLSLVCLKHPSPLNSRIL